MERLRRHRRLDDWLLEFPLQYLLKAWRDSKATRVKKLQKRFCHATNVGIVVTR